MIITSGTEVGRAVSTDSYVKSAKNVAPSARCKNSPLASPHVDLKCGHKNALWQAGVIQGYPLKPCS